MGIQRESAPCALMHAINSQQLSQTGQLKQCAAMRESRIIMVRLITSTIPVLASLDLDASLAFYVQRLGFAQAARYDDYAIVRRDGCEIHFWACGERHIAENTSCYVRIADVQALYEELSGNGVQMAPPVAQPWGMKECHVIDPHGNLLKFGEDLSRS